MNLTVALESLEWLFRVEEVMKNSSIRYVFGQENLVFDRKKSGNFDTDFA